MTQEALILAVPHGSRSWGSM